MTGEAWEHQVAAFPASVAPTLPGHVTPGSPAGFAVMAAAIESVLARAGGPHVVVGHSLGGAIALDLALRCPQRLAGIVLLGSGARLRVAPPLLEALRDRFEQAAEEIARREFAHPDSPFVERLIAMMRRVGREQTLLDFQACDAFDVMDRVGEIRIPLLAACGTHDAMTPPKFSRYLSEHVADGRFAEIPGAGHMAMVEAPQETNRLLSAFVEECG